MARQFFRSPRCAAAALAVMFFCVASFEADSRPKQPAQNFELAPYSGTVEHIFFHPLIVYPDIAFPKSRIGGYMCDWFVTVSEFTRFLEDL
ncbi:MAG: hypothetical protein ACRCUT_08005, partial [Spirochaetota bacterium]